MEGLFFCEWCSILCMIHSFFALLKPTCILRALILHCLNPPPNLVNITRVYNPCFIMLSHMMWMKCEWTHNLASYGLSDLIIRPLPYLLFLALHNLHSSSITPSVCSTLCTAESPVLGSGHLVHLILWFITAITRLWLPRHITIWFAGKAHDRQTERDVLAGDSSSCLPTQTWTIGARDCSFTPVRKSVMNIWVYFSLHSGTGLIVQQYVNKAQHQNYYDISGIWVYIVRWYIRLFIILLTYPRWQLLK